MMLALAIGGSFTVLPAQASGIDGGYVGTDACLLCHDGVGGADKTSFLESGHPYKMRITDGVTPGEEDVLSALLTSTGDNTIASVTALNYDASLCVDMSPVDNKCDVGSPLIDADADGKLDWSAVSYVIGGYGWKARWGIKDLSGDDKTGYVWSSGSVVGGQASQYNLLASDPLLDPLNRRPDWSTYGSASGQSKKYQCAVCHNTNGTTSVDAGCSTPLGSGRSEPWASTTGVDPITSGGFYSEWTFSGVQCEGCHGPGSNLSGTGHADSGASVPQGVLEISGGVEVCAKCHIRAENTSGMGPECGGDANPLILTKGAKITGDYIGHHEQYNEMHGLNEDGVHASLACNNCHDPHVRAHTVTDDVADALGITDNDLSAEARGAVVSCESCHAGKGLRYQMTGVDCVDCHMAEATKSGTSETPDGGWGRMGDVKTHIFKIEPAASTITRSNGFINIAANALSVRYACGKCHDSSMANFPVDSVPLTQASAKLYANDIHATEPYARYGYMVSGLTVNVDASSSYCVSGSCSYAWSWGDGTTTAAGALPTASHDYATGGAKTVILTVKDTVEYASKNRTKTITLATPDAWPTVDGTACGSILNANTWTGTITDASSDDNSVRQVTVNWGDGGMLSSDTTAPFGPFTRTFLNAGTYTITHKAIDSIGQTTQRTCSVSPATFTISGTVLRNDNLTAVPSASVQVRKDGVLKRTVYTSAAGAFTIGNLKPATYTLTVVKPGYTFAIPSATIAVGPSSAGNVINAVTP